MRSNGKLHSGELARLVGVSADTIRHYERIGILPKSPRTASGYRLYRHEAADRVLLVRAALRLGFTLAELKEILQTRDHGGVPCHRVLSLMHEKLLSVRKQIAELHRSERLMTKLVKQWNQKIASREPGTRAMLLQDLSKAAPSPTKKFGPLRRRTSL